MPTREELESDKLVVEIRQISERTQWEAQKTQAEIAELGRPFYARPPFLAAIVTIGGLLFTWASGWFDAKHDKLDAEKKLLELQVMQLSSERSKFVETEAAFASQQEMFAQQQNEFTHKAVAFAAQEVALQQRRDALALDLQSYENERAQWNRDRTTLQADQAELVRVRAEHNAEKQALAEARKALDLEREQLAQKLAEKDKRAPFEIALRDLRAHPDYGEADTAINKLLEALNSAGELQASFLHEVRDAATPDLTQVTYVALCYVMFQQTGQQEWGRALVQRLLSEQIMQSSAYLIDVPDQWGDAMYADFVRAAVGTAIKSPDSIDWFGLNGLIRKVREDLVGIIGPAATLDLAAESIKKASQLGEAHAGGQALEILAVIGPHPYYATIARMLIAHGASMSERDSLRFAPLVFDGPFLSGRPDSANPTVWTQWFEQAGPSIQLWAEEGLGQLRSLSSDALVERCGPIVRQAPAEVEFPPLDMSSAALDLVLEAAPVRHDDDTNAVTHQFRFVIERQDVYILQTQGDSDVIMAVYSANRQEIARDDDNGEGANARIQTTFSPGVYYAVVGQYNGAPFGGSQFGMSIARIK